MQAKYVGRTQKHIKSLQNIPGWHCPCGLYDSDSLCDMCCGLYKGKHYKLEDVKNHLVVETMAALLLKWTYKSVHWTEEELIRICFKSMKMIFALTFTN